MTDTELESLEMETDVVENTEDDWYYYKVKDKKYFGAGDLNKLEFLLYAFKDLVEKHKA